MKSSRRSWFKWLAWAVVLIALVVLYCSDELLFELPQRSAEHYPAKYGRKLRDQHQVAAYWPLEQGRIIDFVSRVEAANLGTVSVPARFGQGRRFDGSRSVFVDGLVGWTMLGSNYTVSCWAKVEPSEKSQSIVCLDTGSRAEGLALRGDEMTLYVPGSHASVSLSYPFTNFNAFVHIAGVVDSTSGKATLYEDGVPMVSTQIRSVVHIPVGISFGKLRPEKVLRPFHGVLDEVVFWNRALSEEQIASEAQRARPLYETLEPEYRLKWRFSEWIQRMIRQALKAVDLFNPFNHYTQAAKADLPQYSLFMSKADQRYFNRAQAHHRVNSWLPRDLLKSRRIQILTDAGMTDARMELYPGNSECTPCTRQSYVLTWTNRSSGLPVHMLFVPAENAGFLREILPAVIEQKHALSHPNNGFAVMDVNGRFKGVYYFEEGQYSPARNRGTREHLANLLYHLPFSRDEVLKVYDHLADLYEKPLMCDAGSALSAREIRYRLRKDRQLLEELLEERSGSETKLTAIRTALSAESFLGKNPSRHYVVDHLSSLQAMSIPGVTIEWQSSAPDIISEDGRVFRPAGDRPARVELTARLTDESGDTASRTLVFRVMPRETKIPALMIHVGGEIWNEVRTDCRIELWEGGVRRSGFLEGGIKTRGNTALHYDKKSYSLKLKAPNRDLAPTGSRYVYLMSCFSDRTFLKNKLSYDIFRSMSETNAVRHSPHVRFCEVFINGAYQGIYEWGDKVDRHLLGLKSDSPQDARRTVLYKAVGMEANFRNDHREAYVQEMPPREEGEYWEPYAGLMNFLGDSAPEDFARDLDKWIDAACFMDFQLFVNFAHNRDGYQHNLYLARNSGDDDVFFVVPWDYDKSLGGAHDRWLENHLFKRLLVDVPGYSQRLKDRWRVLRDDRLSDQNLQRRIDDVVNTLDGYIEWESERWPCEDTYGERVQHIREWIPRRLEFLDDYIASL